MSPSKALPGSLAPLARRIAFPLLSIALAVMLCACTRSIVDPRPASSCLSLIPDTVKAATPGAPLPADDTAGEWVAFGNRQTGQLELANRDKSTAIEIVQRCEARDAETVKALTKHRGLFG